MQRKEQLHQDFGKIFKEIRLSRNMSLQEVSEGIVSVSQLSRFERGISNITINIFYECLNRMNTSVNEFLLISQNYNLSDDLQFFDNLSKAVDAHNIVKLESIVQQCQNLQKDNPKVKKYQLNLIAAKAHYLDLHDHKLLKPTELQFLTDYLFSVDEWGSYELNLFTSCVDFFPADMLDVFASEMLARTQFYSNVPENRTIVQRMLLKVVRVCILDDNLQLARRFITYLEHLDIPDTYVYEKLLIKFNRAFYSYRLGYSNAMSDIQECLTVLKSLECYSVVETLEKDLQKL
ncbi:helix-turn-helix domain-containing protein [Streptococcus loxodontisalivarius]|uniref:Rgg/GadR/MutR family transcriptional activator n=1 Tax=Streptococcus loxodontisalivarius TaxID=1349415 RepID=A0ABS2PQZ9_9STRE|nr:Rgg/GadR/MutR family transcriptional regulator [Streptococcus loxodontisalivarius]MBM7642306.1 Rgg/GadR/MutR family transcriptional activator [Streptococcus loxodontisalivarius]